MDASSLRNDHARVHEQAALVCYVDDVNSWRCHSSSVALGEISSHYPIHCDTAYISLRSTFTPPAASFSSAPSCTALIEIATPFGFFIVIVAGPLPAEAAASAATYTPSKSESFVRLETVPLADTCA